MSFKITLYSAEEIRSLLGMGFTEDQIIAMCCNGVAAENVKITANGVYIEFENSMAAAKYLSLKHNVPTYKFVPEHNGIEIYFPKKPDDEVRVQLSQNGWRWSNYKNCWYAKKTAKSLDFARKLCNVDNGQKSDSEICDDEKARMEADEKKRQAYIAMIKPQFDQWEWRSEYDDYSIYRLEKLYARHEQARKESILARVPEKLLTYLKCSKWSALQFSLEKTKKLQLLGEEYLELIEKLTTQTAIEAEKQFWVIYDELSASVAEAERKRNSNATGECVCSQCGNRYVGQGELCPTCFSYLGFDGILKKIDLKTSSFWKNLSVFGGMQPIGVARNFHMGVNSSKLSGVDYLYEIEQPKQKTVDGLDALVLQKIQLHYHKVAKRLLEKYSKEEIMDNKRTFSVLVVCLKLSNNEQLVREYIEEYCLKRCEEKWRSL